MIPAEIVQIILIILFFVLWIAEKGKNAKLHHDIKKLEEKNRELEISNASLSGALADRDDR